MTDLLTDIQRKIFDYVQKNTHSDIRALKPDTMLFREGIMDSMAFVLLIDYLEEHFGIHPGDEDLVEENFESIDSISRYIMKKKELVALPSA